MEIMKKELIEQLSGRDLDAAVAERVMGEAMPSQPDPATCPLILDRAVPSPESAWLHVHIYEHGDKCEWTPLPFSRSIEATMRILDKADGLWELMRYPQREDEQDDESQWLTFYSCSLRFGDRLGSATQCESAPLAICRAALAAIESKE